MNPFNQNFDNGQREGGRHQHGRRGGQHPQGFGPRGFGERGFAGQDPRGGFGGQHDFGGPEGREGFEGRDGLGEGGFQGRDGLAQGGFGGHGFGPRDFGAGREFGMGFGGPRGPRGGRGGRGPGRGRKGDVRNAILSLLATEQLNGYQLITRIAEKSDGLWRPSAGSIYPALGLLEDEGLIVPVDVDGKKVFQLTEQGQAYAAEHADELDQPWAKVAEPHKGFLDVRDDMRLLGMALQQVVVAGDEAQIEAARAILENARKDLYRLLAGDAGQGDQQA